MADIVEFPKPPEPLIWQCNCGCRVFMLYETGEVECLECQTIHEGVWVTFED